MAIGPDHYHFIHSAGEAKEDRVGGALVMISVNKVVPRNTTIQFHDVHPGRLLHVRVKRKQPIDVLNLYQYTANDHKQTTERRHKFLLRLQHTLQGLPTRHTLILGGDLSTTCTPLANSLASTLNSMGSSRNPVSNPALDCTSKYTAHMP